MTTSPTPPTPEPLHPQIARFVREAMPEMSAAQAAGIIGCDEKTVRRLCVSGELAGHQLGRARGDASNQRWTITKAALITYLVRQTTGDKALILAAIDEMCPRWLKVAQQAALPRPEAEPTSNIIPMQRKRTTHADPFAGHPDFFKTA